VKAGADSNQALATSGACKIGRLSTSQILYGIACTSDIGCPW